MTNHKYRVGQALAFDAGPAVHAQVPGLYEVTRLMPTDGAELQYRVRGQAGGPERVVRESQLRHP